MSMRTLPVRSRIARIGRCTGLHARTLNYSCACHTPCVWIDIHRSHARIDVEAELWICIARPCLGLASAKSPALLPQAMPARTRVLQIVILLRSSHVLKIDAWSLPSRLARTQRRTATMIGSHCGLRPECQQHYDMPAHSRLHRPRRQTAPRAQIQPDLQRQRGV